VLGLFELWKLARKKNRKEDRRSLASCVFTFEKNLFFEKKKKREMLVANSPTSKGEGGKEGLCHWRRAVKMEKSFTRQHRIVEMGRDPVKERKGNALFAKKKKRNREEAFLQTKRSDWVDGEEAPN